MLKRCDISSMMSGLAIAGTTFPIAATTLNGSIATVRPPSINARYL
jgi:hypothetical protein